MDLPFACEYAKSGRASCKLCKSAIAKDSLRMAIMVQSPHFDGKQPNWHHFACFWKRARVPEITDIKNFDSLRWDDQKKIEEKLSGNGTGDAKESGAKAAGKDGYADFSIQYAKSGRSVCRGCEDKISKDVVRIAKKDYEDERSRMYGPQDKWYHIDCFVKNRGELMFDEDMQPKQIAGFKQLKGEDQEEVTSKLGKGSAKRKIPKTKETKEGAKKAKSEDPEEKALKLQSQLIWNIRDKLQKVVGTSELKALLVFNEQTLFTKNNSETRLLDMVCDAMTFGALEKCGECDGQLEHCSSRAGYVCRGDISEWTKCQLVTRHPKRKPFKIPPDVCDIPFLKKYKYVKRERIFPSNSVIASASADTLNGQSIASKPLLGMRFVVCGLSGTESDEVKNTLEKLGGSFAATTDSKTMAVICKKAAMTKKLKEITAAKKLDINVVSSSFLDSVKEGQVIDAIKEHSIADWGSDPSTRVGDVVDGLKKSVAKSMARSTAAGSSSMFTKNVATTATLTLKGGAAVDPSSELEYKGHIMKDSLGLWTAVLNKVDVVKGTNSFYKLQLIQSDKKARWWVFRSWGRIGTTVGGDKTEKFSSKLQAMEEFRRLYLEKSGNVWGKPFEKRAGFMFPVEIDHGAESQDVKMLDLKGAQSSKLSLRVQEFVKLIFDIDSMKKTMLEFEIDLKKMPLGKISKKQIELAFKILTELSKILDATDSVTKILDATNRFYSLIPHDFGLDKMPLLNTDDIIKKKTDMLSNLLDIEIAFNLMNVGEAESHSAIDVQYEKLKTEIVEVPPDSDEFKQIELYVKNTHAATHKSFKLEIEDVFKLKRQGEGKRYRPFKEMNNRMLLWHGSRTTNFAGILSQGLRIAPPEAPVTGYMFGKGIYFADMVSKSANYCCTSSSNPTGLLLLCEVALGDMHTLKSSDCHLSGTTLPKGKHSTKGMGRTAPDPSCTVKAEDGVEIPLGEGKPSGVDGSSLLYNEFIVYDTAQVNIKYLLRLKFNYSDWW